MFQHPDRCVRLPMIPGARSLNLSNTVAIAVYEVLRQWDFEALKTQGELTRFSWENASFPEGDEALEITGEGWEKPGKSRGNLPENT